VYVSEQWRPTSKCLLRRIGERADRFGRCAASEADHQRRQNWGDQSRVVVLAQFKESSKSIKVSQRTRKKHRPEAQALIE
jgi:hypothetical protein